MSAIEHLRRPSKHFPILENFEDLKMTSEVRIRITPKMRNYLEICATQYGYTSMSKFCRDILKSELDAFVEDVERRR